MNVFIWTAKLHKGALAVALTLLLALGLGLTVGLATASRPTAVTESRSAKGVKTAEDRIAYLESYGWQVSPDATTVEELALPDSFGEEYARYLALQSAQDFDLTKYAGKRVKRYSYEVLNHPVGAGVTAHLLLYRNRVVGGELMGTDFLVGLDGTAADT